MKLSNYIAVFGLMGLVLCVMSCAHRGTSRNQTESSIDSASTMSADSIPSASWVDQTLLNGEPVHSGLAWISTVEDTARLKEFGFILMAGVPIAVDEKNEVMGVWVAWPVALDVDSLPSFIHNLIRNEPMKWVH